MPNREVADPADACSHSGFRIRTLPLEVDWIVGVEKVWIAALAVVGGSIADEFAGGTWGGCDSMFE